MTSTSMRDEGVEGKGGGVEDGGSGGGGERIFDPTLFPSLYRLTESIPRRELKLLVSEARACEDALEKEIKELNDELSVEAQRMDSGGGDEYQKKRQTAPT